MFWMKMLELLRHNVVRPHAWAIAGFTYRFWLERIPRASLLRTVR